MAKEGEEGSCVERKARRSCEMWKWKLEERDESCRRNYSQTLLIILPPESYDTLGSTDFIERLNKIPGEGFWFWPSVA